MRLIDADKMRKDVLDLPNCYNGNSDTYDKAYIIDLIDEQPTVEPQIIRCKACKHHHYQNDIPYCDRIDYGYGWKDEDYCSFAERRSK